MGALYVAAKGGVVYGEEEVAMGKLLAEGLSAGLETARLFQSVADERSMMEAVLASTRDAILTVNLQGTVVLANRAVRAWTFGVGGKACFGGSVTISPRLGCRKSAVPACDNAIVTDRTVVGACATRRTSEGVSHPRSHSSITG